METLKQNADHYLRAFGHTVEHPDGGLVHPKSNEKFTPVDGGFHLHVLQHGTWVQFPHHVNATPAGFDENGNPHGPYTETPVYLWPEEHVAHVHRAAVDPDYHEMVATKHRWDVEAGKLVPREPEN